VSKMVLSKIVDPLTVIRLTVLHDDAGERLWGTMLAMYCVYIELFSRTSHKSSNRDSSHPHITTPGCAWFPPGRFELCTVRVIPNRFKIYIAQQKTRPGGDKGRCYGSR
jgi:hypothetical protein